ncbi:MAG TPA: hypothetical protein VGI40_22920 [Pirellulaceae bacterium]|jgi:hypothetical protein
MAITNKNSTSDPPPLTLPAPTLTAADTSSDKWQHEYQAFLRLRPELLATNAGSYVVIHDGRVVDSGPDDVVLALRFFEQYGNTPAYIGLITQSPDKPERIPHYRQADLGAGG